MIVTIAGDSAFDNIRLSCNTAVNVQCTTALATSRHQHDGV